MNKQKTTYYQNGLTLVEIMIAITLSLVLLAGIMQIFLSSKQSYNIQQALSRVQENARLVTDIMLRDMTAAGYRGCLRSNDDKDRVVNVLSDKSVNYDYAAAIEGNEGGNDPDSITVRRVNEGLSIAVTEGMMKVTDPVKLDTMNLNYSGLKQWDVVTLSDCTNSAVFMITNEPDTDGYIEHEAGIVADSGVNEGQSNSDPGLKHLFGTLMASRAKLYRTSSTTYEVLPSASGKTTSLYLSGEELVEGVEDLQIEYGISNSPANPATQTIAEQYLDADAVTAGNHWDDVITVRITFVVNSGDLVVNPGSGDGKLRKTFRTTIRLRNRVPA